MAPPRVLAVIQARMGSTRLPGKVLLRVAGDTVLGHVVRRVRNARGVDRTVVATTTLPEDDTLVSIAEAHGAEVVRGPADDVLARYAMAFSSHGGEVGVRVTADCPCLDPQLLSDGLEQFVSAEPQPDYLSNTLERSFPRGYDFEVFRVEALLIAAAEAQDTYSREHVTPFLYRHPERFRLMTFRREDPANTAGWRLTLDTPEDWRVLEHLFRCLSPQNPLFGLTDVEDYLRSAPEILQWNQGISQTEA